MLVEKSCDMFSFPADVRINTVNTEGAMGKGVALEFKRRYPDMYKEYKRHCKNGLYRPGNIYIWWVPNTRQRIINFATKDKWSFPSQYEWIESGLTQLEMYLRGCSETDVVTLPALGCGNGGLNWVRVKAMIWEKLEHLPQIICVFGPHTNQLSQVTNQLAEQGLS